MRQAIHIFRKDVRAQAIQIAVTLLAVCFFGFLGVRQAWSSSENWNLTSDIFGPLLTFSWWLLVVRVIQSEAPAGDRQFWCTRPYSWQILLTAKGLFILAFVNLPLLIADAVILHVYGFSLWSEVPGLLGSQLLLTTVLILPMASLAAVTNGVAQLLTTAFRLLLILVASTGAISGVNITGPWGPLNWIRSATSVVIATAATLTVIFWQYRGRKTVRSRILIGIAFVAAISTPSIIPWTWAFGIQSKFSHERIEPSTFTIKFDLGGRKWLARALPLGDHVEVEIPLGVADVPDDVDYIPEGFAVSLEAADGTRWRSKRYETAQVNREAGILSMNTSLDEPLYRKIRKQPVTLRGTLYLTVTGHQHHTDLPIQKRRVRVYRGSVCSAQRVPNIHRNYAYSFFCHSAFRSPAEFISASLGHANSQVMQEAISYSPFPADLQITPVIPYSSAAIVEGRRVDSILLVSTEPIASITRDVELKGLRLSDLEPFGLQAPLP